jgi:uncharacterized protein
MSSYRVLQAVGVGTLVIGVITALILAGGAMRAAQAHPSVTSGQAPRQITAIGHGHVNVTPDLALAQLGVRTEHESLKAALDATNAQMDALVAKLKELGVADADIQTSSISIEPRFSKETGMPMPGHQVSNAVAVTIRDVGQAGVILEQALGAGANQVLGFSFGVAERGALEQAARDKAITDAQARAEAMAHASRATIGQVLSINENLGMAGSMAAYAGMAGGDVAGMPIQPGQQTVGAQIQVTFELK